MFEHRLVQRACRTAGPLVCLFLVLFPLGACRSTQPGGSPIKVGLIVRLSGPSAASGQAIQRGVLLATDEVNRETLEHLRRYDGRVKRYAPAFTPQNHDALDATHYIMTVWRGTTLVPTAWPRLEK